MSSMISRLLDEWRSLREERTERRRQIAAQTVFDIGGEGTRPHLKRWAYKGEPDDLARDALRYLVDFDRGAITGPHAVRSNSFHYASKPTLTKEWARQAFLNVANWCDEVYLKPLEGNYGRGTVEQVAKQARAMWQFASACNELAARYGVHCRHFSEAAGRHAFAALAADPSMVVRMDPDAAKRLADDAERHTSTVLRSWAP